MPNFVEIGPPVPEKILVNSTTRLYDLRIPNKTPIENAYAIFERGSQYNTCKL